MLVTIRQKGRPDRTASGSEGQTVLSFLANQGIYLDAPCSGHGKCGKCLVRLSGEVDSPGESEKAALECRTQADTSDAGELRLACRAKLTGKALIELQADARFSSVKGLGESEPYEVSPALKKAVFRSPGRHHPQDLMSTHKIASASLEALSQIAAIDAERRDCCGIMWHDELLAALALDSPQADLPLLAAAVDLGTTGLAVALLDVTKGEVIAQETALNPQTACGGDVISRITMASEGPEKLAHLQNLALCGIGNLILEAAGPERIKSVKAVVISGNTTMLYLLAGIQPKGLAQSPYRPAFVRSLDISSLAERFGLTSGTKILTTPSISAYVGGDITSGMLAVGLKQRGGTVLYIDIGTNGEIVLSHDGKLVATSCAAGPALEGMNIICGQRAIPGAVDSFFMGPDFNYRFTTIGEAEPTGICGSGLIDLAAELVKNGLLNSTGRLKAPQEAADAPAWFADLEEGRFKLTGKVFFDQKDVRQVQLAKGAIAAAVEMLLARFGLSENGLDEIIIAGAFGFHLKAESLKTIGLIPNTYDGPVRFVGNSSLAGAARTLLTPNAIAELDALAAETEVIELGFDPAFQEKFVRHLRF